MEFENVLNVEKQNEEKSKKKLEKIEKERQEVIDNLVTDKIFNIRDRVAYILNKSISARNSDKKLAWLYWKEFESNLWNGNTISSDEFMNLTSISSLSRIRAKIQNEYFLFQANQKVKKFRGVLEKEKKQEAIADKPIHYPFYNIFIDETGKNLKYLSVGSLWVTDQSSRTIAYHKLRSWKKNKSIDFEFHFVKVTNHKLEVYKEFFQNLLTWHPGIAFKVIIIDGAGFSNITEAITHLTFHLISKGIMHEDKTGRAPLPRKLQVTIDNEEKGSDKMKLENLKERIENKKIDGLIIDKFEAIDSKDDLYLQAVDLFIASVNRKLHSSENTNNAKDQLAEFILNLLKFDLKIVDSNNNDIDNATVFDLTYGELP
jgi:hypothetical protein